MFKRKQVWVVIGVALVSFLLGTIVSVTTVSIDSKGDPQKKIRPSEPQVLTVFGYQDWTRLEAPAIDVWIDLLSVSDVAVPEGANVLAIASGNFKCMEPAYAPFGLRHRANDSYGEKLFQGFASGIWTSGTERELIEIHHTWTNLTAGSYTFAIQHDLNPVREVYVRRARLTLLII